MLTTLSWKPSRYIRYAVKSFLYDTLTTTAEIDILLVVLRYVPL